MAQPTVRPRFLNIQPVIPVTVGDWNLINRLIVPLIDTPGLVTGTPEIPNPVPGDGATGLGDINYSVFVSPAEPGKVIWGVGPSIMMDTATDDQLGIWPMERRSHSSSPYPTQAMDTRPARPTALVFCG